MTKKQLGRATWAEPTMSATLIIGENKGKKFAANKEGFCATRPAKFTTKAVEKTVRHLRELQLQDQYPTKSDAEIQKMYSASSTSGRGWYEGDPEGSVAVTFHNEAGKKSLPEFRASMRRLADRVASVLCQDSVLLNFDTPGERGTEGRTTVPGEGATKTDAQTRARAQELFTKERRR